MLQVQTLLLGYDAGEFFSCKKVFGHGFPFKVSFHNTEMDRNVVKMQTDSLQNGKRLQTDTNGIHDHLHSPIL